MVQMKTKMWAIVVASSLLSSTALIGAADRESTTPAASQEQFRASIAQAMATMPMRSAARGALQAAAQAGQDQDPPRGRRPRASQSCSCGIPSWIKYSLIGVAAAGGGYALSQAMRQGDGGRRGVDGPDGAGR